jgi:hypothetical protein
MTFLENFALITMYLCMLTLTVTWTTIILKSLGVNKSPTLKIQDSSNGEAYFIYGYGGGSQLGFYKNGSVRFWNGKSWSKGGKWDPNSSDKDGQLIGGWLTDKTGKKVSLSPAITNAYKYFG